MWGMTIFVYGGQTYSASNGTWTKWNFFLFCKFFNWGSVNFTLETMAANMNKHETFPCVASFEEMNFSKSTTENNSANNLPFLKMKKRRQIYMIHKEIYHNYRIQNLQSFYHHIIWKIFCLHRPIDCFSRQKNHQNLGQRIRKLQYYNFWKFRNFVKWENCSKHLPPVQRINHLCIIDFHLFLFIGNGSGWINYSVRLNHNLMFVLIPYCPKKMWP